MLACWPVLVETDNVDSVRMLLLAAAGWRGTIAIGAPAGSVFMPSAFILPQWPVASE